MNGWLRTGLLVVLLCCGAACGSLRTGQPDARPAYPSTPALPPDGGGGEPARGARAGDLQSPPDRPSTSGLSQPALPTDGDCKSPARRLQKWNPIWWFGNVDDPVPPDWYRPGSRCRGVLWQLRNPLHNFTFHVIGVADRPFTRAGRFPQHVFAPAGGWNWTVTRLGWVRLPFLSFNGEWCRFYLGWRERGNFGGKVNFGRLPAEVAKPPP